MKLSDRNHYFVLSISISEMGNCEGCDNITIKGQDMEMMVEFFEKNISGYIVNPVPIPPTTTNEAAQSI